jgi:hypothetical protein
LCSTVPAILTLTTLMLFATSVVAQTTIFKRKKGDWAARFWNWQP